MKQRSFLALAATCIVSLSALNAATIPGAFQQIDCEGGGWFEQVIPHSSGRLYGRTDVGGMYRSDDHGETWRFLSGDIPSPAAYYVQGVAVSAANPDVVYQATGVSYYESDPGRGIWKSVNGGTSWTQVLAGVNFSGNDLERWGSECLIIAPDNDNKIWAGTRGEGLRMSTDAGANWTNIAPAVFDTPNVIIASINIHPTTPNTIWVAGTGGVWVSTNGGTSWTQKITATRIYRVALKPDGTAFAAGTNNGSNVLYRLTAAGSATNLYANYLAALPYQPFSGNELATVQVLANGDLWVSDLFEFTCRSTNNGDSFTRMPMTLTGPLPRWSRPGTTSIEGGRNGLVQDPTNLNRLFLGGGYAPFKSEDGGATWSFMTRGIGETVAWRASFHPTDPNRVWLPLADLGATTVNDAGASGLSSGYIAHHFPYPDDNVVFTHRALVSASKVIAPGGEQATHQARIYQSTDNGTTWTKLAATGLPTANNREIIEAVASADNPDDFLVFTASPISASEGGIYRTTNGGANFTRASGLPVGYDPGAEFYWNVSLERDAADNNVRYALLRNDGFWKSTNRGASWTKPTAQPGGSFGRLRVDPISARLWIGHAFGLEFSANGGATWAFISGITSVSELDAHNGRIAIIGRRAGDTTDHIYVSADNGGTWDEITRPGYRFANAAAVAVDPWRPGTIWISTGGRSVARFTPGAALQVASAASTKVHGSAGSFSIPLPLTGEPGVECRSSGGNHTLVFTFSDNIAGGSASLASGTGSVGGSNVYRNTMTVDLTGVSDVQKITVSLNNVTDLNGQVLPNTLVSMNVLSGDTNGNKQVNASDIGQTKSQSGSAVTASNFRQDVAVSGTITASDVGLVKARAGNSVP